MKAFKSSTIIAILFILVTFSLYPNHTKQNLSNISDITKEKNVEIKYIEKDALLTTKMNVAQDLANIKFFLEKNKDIVTLKRKFTEIEYIHPMPSKNKITEKFIMEIDKKGAYVLADLKVKNETASINYRMKLRPSIFSEIKKKQQLRMFTVTYLQNNRWKTIPTKYQSKKNLGLSINKRLPDLKPQEDEKGISHYIKHEVVIKLKDGVTENYIKQLSSKYNFQVKKHNKNFILAYSKDNSTKELLRLLEKEKSKSSELVYAEPHFIYLTNSAQANGNTESYSFIPNDVLYQKYQWNLPLINTEQAWKWTKGNESVIIAIIDTGVDLNHTEFKGKIIKGINILDPSLPPNDDDGHGTHVAGIISANTNNNEGIAGITWYNKIMPIKVLDQSGAGTLYDVAQGIIWATDHGAKVINLSLGNYAESKYLHDAIKYAYNHDVVLVAASGNDNTDKLSFPAAYPEVIAVSASDSSKRRTNFSNFGSYIDVVAPGVNIASTYPGNRYAALTGTSMASPHVAALAGLIRALNPSLSNKDVGLIIKNTATDLGKTGKDNYYGYGEINIKKAILYASPKSIYKNMFKKWIEEILLKRIR